MSSNLPNLKVSTGDVEALGRVLRTLQVSSARAIEASRIAHDSGRPAETVLLARKLKSARNVRASYIDDSFLSEPGWDMLLAVYIAHGEGYRLKVGDVTEQSGVAQTTALRWIEKLISAGYLTKEGNPLDARSMFISPTEMCLTKLTELFLKIDRQYLHPSV